MRRLPLVLSLTVVTALGAWAFDQLSPPDLTRYRAASLEIDGRNGETLHVATAADGMWRLPTRPEDVAPNYLDDLIAVEDHRFWSHVGVDPLALARAAWQVATRGHVVSGGSTLTMQVARLLEPHRHDVAGKLIDIVRALQLEAHYSKREILSIYLTLAPFGGNMEGVRTASLAYFGHEASVLSDAEAALLIALPQSPTRLRPDRHPDRAALRQRALLERLHPDIASASEPLTIERRHLAELAPHLAQRLKNGGAVGRVRTTIDPAVQTAIEQLARRETPWLGGRADVAVLVVRNDDRSVLAYLGGTDYFGRQGMVDMTRARRSPGSTLKPFIYGLGLDDALILPGTLIVDAPARLGDYAPQNFDRRFHGTVTVSEALQQSYNLPAVEILRQIGPGRLAASLQQAGATLTMPHGILAPGLPIALGGLGINLEDLTALYVTLARHGEAAHLRLLADDPPVRGTPLMTEAAARQIGTVLRGTPRPDGLAPERERAIAYKTGTSYGYRDAWALGYSSAFTVGVWVGRVEGSPRPGAIGRNTAAPLLFRVFDLLPQEASSSPVAAVEPPAPTLAPALRRFAPQRGALAALATPELKIAFPPAGAKLDLGRGASAAPIALEAVGGAPPYRWAVDGVPLPEPPLGIKPSWLPPGPGFVRLSVIDRDNRAVSEEIRLY
jgi:penicillin-binding protein 1C